jgi:hypothetical protein
MICPRRQCFFLICYTWRTILGTCHHNSYKISRNEVSMFLIGWTLAKISFTIRLFFNLSEQTCIAIEAGGNLNVVFLNSQMRTAIFICVFLIRFNPFGCNIIQQLPFYVLSSMNVGH